NMKRLSFLLLFLLVAGFPAAAQSTAQEPENHAVVVERLMRYHDYGEYDREIRDVANAARDYLAYVVKSSPKTDKLAAVFDIDETSLSNWAQMADCGFCSYSIQEKLYPDARDPAIIPVLELYNDAKSKGVAVFFLTGRSEGQRNATVKNLSEVGYSGWADLLMRPDTNKLPASVFKSDVRQTIANKGYRIVLNIGDQASDLAGCCAERNFKLPNPFYLVK
ncbi:MAG TPA: HAD family acid phosphatase, partial [Verrucomicrobiae bacterium]|nr:HAD family acid phosphatase [Verrucomicrobiae bacterium]